MYLCILDSNPSLVMYVINIICQSVTCLLTLYGVFQLGRSFKNLKVGLRLLPDGDGRQISESHRVKL